MDLTRRRADLYDLVTPLAAHISLGSTAHTRSAYLAVTLATLSCLPLLPLLFLPTILIRLVFLVAGLAPFLLTHPFTQRRLHTLLAVARAQGKRWRMRAARWVDDDRLGDACWRARARGMREVELWENERWSAESRGWRKGALKPGERAAWTRCRDGWSGNAAVTSEEAEKGGYGTIR
jgi:hypothetical protein